MEILKAENLVKYYGKGESLVKAVDHSSFSVASGEFVAIVGTSGSGKSTILNLVGGLDTPDEGRVIIDGQDISKMTQDELTVFRRRKIGFIFQNYNLVSVLNVYKNIVMPVKLDGSQVDKAYISRIMKMLGIENKRKAFPGQLSGAAESSDRADSDPDHRFVRDGDRNCSGNDQRKTDESGTGMQRRCDHGRSGSI